MKRILSVFLALVLLSTLVLPASAANTCILDKAGLLTDQGRQELEQLAGEISQESQCGVYFITVPDYRDYSSASVFDAAKALYEIYDLGMGDGKDGVLLVLSMEDRDYSLIAHGFGDIALNDSGKDYVSEAFLSYFGENDWYYGCMNYLYAAQKLLKQARNGNIYDRNTVSATQQWVWSLILGLVIALIVCLIQKGVQQKKVRQQTQALGYLKGKSVQITHRSDRYTHTTEVRTKIESDKTSASGSSSYSHSDGYSGKSGKF